MVKVDVAGSFEAFERLAWAFVVEWEAILAADSLHIEEASWVLDDLTSNCSRRHCRTSPD